MYSKCRASLPAVLIVMASFLLSACGGSGLDPEADATAAADRPAVTSLTLVAKGSKFDQSILVFKAGEQIRLSLDNQDSNLLHNFSLYESEGGANLYRGELFNGKKVVDSIFTAPEPGVYYFRCDAHPEMEGSVIAR